MTKPGPSKSLRDLLTALGVGDFNATMIIPYMMISPATCDPKSAQIILLVQHVQRALYGLGATSVANTGYLDAQTAAALQDLVGPGWEGMPWATNVQAIIGAQETGMRFHKGKAPSAVPVAVGGPLDFLPDVPGGIVTYGVAAYLLYRHFSKRRHA
jgi:hypothetical protein